MPVLPLWRHSRRVCGVERRGAPYHLQVPGMPFDVVAPGELVRPCRRNPPAPPSQDEVTGGAALAQTNGYNVARDLQYRRTLALRRALDGRITQSAVRKRHCAVGLCRWTGASAAPAVRADRKRLTLCVVNIYCRVSV